MLTVYTMSEFKQELKIINDKMRYVLAYPVVNPVRKSGEVYTEFRLLNDELRYDRMCMNIPEYSQMERWKMLMFESYISKISEIALHS